MTEAQIQDAIRLELGKVPDLVLWRNNVGIAEHWNGKSVDIVKYGLAPGSSDLIGLLGPRGRWIALEVKSETGVASPEQMKFLRLVQRMGGFACIVRSVDEAVKALARARAGSIE